MNLEAKEWVLELWYTGQRDVNYWLQYTNSADDISTVMKVGKTLQTLYPREAWRIRNVRTNDILPVVIL